MPRKLVAGSEKCQKISYHVQVFSIFKIFRLPGKLARVSLANVPKNAICPPLFLSAFISDISEINIEIQSL